MFDSDFKTADIGDGNVVSFTEAESRLLGFMSQHPGKTLTRDQILDGISHVGSEKTDRSIDYLINRVRKKLGDDPKAPKFIATRYGGGYVWVAPRTEEAPATLGAHVVIVGPRALEEMGVTDDEATGFVTLIAKSIEDQLSPEKRVVVSLDAASLESDPPIRVELVFFRQNTGLECVLSCWSGASRKLYLAKRFNLQERGGIIEAADLDLRELATDILSNRWRSDLEFHLSDTPLPVAMHEAATEREDSREFHKEVAPQLVKFRRDYPDDPHIKLVYATHIHSDYVLNGFELAMRERGRRTSDLAEIESLVLDALDYAQSNPHLALMAGKLLYFVDKGYRSLALEISEKAYQSSTSVVGSLAVFGQLQSFLGEADVGIYYLKQALALAKTNSTFERYVLVLLCQALIAADRRDELEPYRSRIYGHHPLLRVFLEPLFTDPDRPSLRARGAVMVMSRAKMNALLSHVHFAWSRLYLDPAEQANTIRAPLSLAVRRFGPDIVPDEVRSGIPHLFT